MRFGLMTGRLQAIVPDDLSGCLSLIHYDVIYIVHFLIPLAIEYIGYNIILDI